VNPHCSRKSFLARLAGLVGAVALAPSGRARFAARSRRLDPVCPGRWPSGLSRVPYPAARIRPNLLLPFFTGDALAHVTRFLEAVQFAPAPACSLSLRPGGTVTAAVTYYCTPKYLRVGYAPVQPVPYDHSLHAGQLGLDCRYCHSNVDQSGFANLPTSQTCMNCHKLVKPQSPLLAVVRASFESGAPVPWVQVHKAPDYVYFNHAIHVNRGVSCVECHGRIDQMTWSPMRSH